MLMEHAPGRRLSTVSSSMNAEQHFAVVRSLIGFEQKLTANPLCKFGGVYLTDDCPKDSVKNNRMSSILQKGYENTSGFTIGHVPDINFWPDRIQDLDVDQGPCKYLGRVLHPTYLTQQPQGIPRWHILLPSQTVRLLYCRPRKTTSGISISYKNSSRYSRSCCLWTKRSLDQHFGIWISTKTTFSLTMKIQQR